jgi:hypothetical protein
MMEGYDIAEMVRRANEVGARISRIHQLGDDAYRYAKRTGGVPQPGWWEVGLNWKHEKEAKRRKAFKYSHGTGPTPVAALEQAIGWWLDPPWWMLGSKYNADGTLKGTKPKDQPKLSGAELLAKLGLD